MLGRQATLGVLSVLLALCANGRAEIEPSGKADHASQTIPLKQVWAWRMPGTQDVQNLEAEQRSTKEPVLKQIRRILSRGLPKGEISGPGFVVAGQGKEALKNALRVMASNKPPKNTFSSGEELSVVFFTYSSSRYIHLKSVVKHHHRIELAYEMVPHKTKEVTEHFALVSLGKMDAGKYDVKFVRMPLTEKYERSGFTPVAQEHVNRIVCQSFSFTVSD